MDSAAIGKIFVRDRFAMSKTFTTEPSVSFPSVNNTIRLALFFPRDANDSSSADSMFVPDCSIKFSDNVLAPAPESSTDKVFASSKSRTTALFFPKTTIFDEAGLNFP